VVSPLFVLVWPAHEEEVYNFRLLFPQRSSGEKLRPPLGFHVVVRASPFYRTPNTDGEHFVEWDPYLMNADIEFQPFHFPTHLIV